MFIIIFYCYYCNSGVYIDITPQLYEATSIDLHKPIFIKDLHKPIFIKNFIISIHFSNFCYSFCFTSTLPFLYVTQIYLLEQLHIHIALKKYIVFFVCINRSHFMLGIIVLFFILNPFLLYIIP